MRLVGHGRAIPPSLCCKAAINASCHACALPCAPIAWRPEALPPCGCSVLVQNGFSNSRLSADSLFTFRFSRAVYERQAPASPHIVLCLQTKLLCMRIEQDSHYPRMVFFHMLRLCMHIHDDQCHGECASCSTC